MFQDALANLSEVMADAINGSDDDYEGACYRRLLEALEAQPAFLMETLIGRLPVPKMPKRVCRERLRRGRSGQSLNCTKMNTYATYCPEDNKLRLYVGRVPREEYEALRAEGWTSTPKQSCDFVAVWTVEREDRALSYSDGVILDEDQTPEERAADRAERFSGYRDKRLGEALGHADRFDAGPQVHGYQDHGRAVRAADRHDRIAGRAVDAWRRAEYWTQRTAGVIGHALYKSEPGVRMGRINTLESQLRKAEANLAEYRARWQMWQTIAAGHPRGKEWAENDSNYGREYQHPRTPRKASLYSLLNDAVDPITPEEAASLWLSTHPSPDSEAFEGSTFSRWLDHYRLRLAYERQMLEAQGGRLEQVEVLPGGRFGGKLILKVNKSAVTKRAKSVSVLAPAVRGYTYRVRNFPGTEWAEAQFDLERYAPEMYQPPTPESLAELASVREKIAQGRPDSTTPSLVNPTEEDAERLQALLNTNERRAHWEEPPKVLYTTQAKYSEASKGTYSRCETREITGGGFFVDKHYMAKRSAFPGVTKVRTFNGSVVVLKDKPQKSLPLELWHDPRPEVIAECVENSEEIRRLCGSAWSSDWTDEQRELMTKAHSVGLINWASVTQISLTDKGRKLLVTAVAA